MQAAAAWPSRHPRGRREPDSQRDPTPANPKSPSFISNILAHNSMCSGGIQLLSQYHPRQFTIALGNLLLWTLPTCPGWSDQISLYQYEIIGLFLLNRFVFSISYKGKSKFLKRTIITFKMFMGKMKIQINFKIFELKGMPYLIMYYISLRKHSYWLYKIATTLYAIFLNI